ncbi:MAG: hypothetical protein PHX51_05075 [Clostridia bacterium]|nr:hypothetical protein [Clostridia bacterium]
MRLYDMELTVEELKDRMETLDEDKNANSVVFNKSNYALTSYEVNFYAQTAAVRCELTVSSATPKTIVLKLLHNGEAVHMEQLALETDTPVSLDFSNVLDVVALSNALELTSTSSVTLESCKISVSGYNVSKYYDFSCVDCDIRGTDARLLCLYDGNINVLDNSLSVLHTLSGVNDYAKVRFYTDADNLPSVALMYIDSQKNLRFSSVEGFIATASTVAQEVSHFTAYAINGGLRVYYVSRGRLYTEDISVNGTVSAQTATQMTLTGNKKVIKCDYIKSSGNIPYLLVSVSGGLIVCNLNTMAQVCTVSMSKLEAAFFTSATDLALFAFNDKKCVCKRVLDLSDNSVSAITEIRFCDAFMRVTAYTDWFVVNGTHLLMSAQS